jgi:hypothetical protein
MLRIVHFQCTQENQILEVFFFKNENTRSLVEPKEASQNLLRTETDHHLHSSLEMPQV